MAVGTGAISERRLWLTVILPFAIGFMIVVSARSINAVLAHPLEAELHLASSELGFVTASYMIAFSLTQIPLGLLLDRWGARLTLALFFLVGGLGMILFGLGSGPLTLSIGRALLGIGTAGGLMGAFKAISEWVEQDRIPFFNGVMLGAGGVGALLATSPAKLFEVEFGWRALCYVIGAAMIGAAVLIFVVNRDRQETSRPALREETIQYVDILRDRYFWHIVPVFAVGFGAFNAMQGLWLGPWFTDVVGLPPVASAHYLFVVALAMTVGSLCNGPLALAVRRLDRPLTVMIGTGSVLTIAAQVLLVAGIGGRSIVLWFAYGFVAQIVIVSYAILAQHFGSERAGRAVTGANIFVFMFAALTQFGFGLIADLWPDDATDPAAGYRAAFVILVALQAAALAWFVIEAMRGAGVPRRT